MFEKLLSLLLHAKGGAVATVLVLGASGALVTATVENGLATVTVTQPSTTTTGSETTTGGTTTTTTNPAILALFNNTKKEGATEPATGNGCSDAAHTNNEQVKLVNEAYKTDHAAVQGLSKTAPKTDEAKKLVKDADNKIKGFRQEAVKKIHELFKSDECKGQDDEDKDTEDDDDSTTGATGATGATTGTTTTTVAISCSDAKACADAAITAMDLEVTNLRTALGALSTAPATTNTTSTDKAKSDNKSGKGNSGKGKGHSEGKSHNDDD